MNIFKISLPTSNKSTELFNTIRNAYGNFTKHYIKAFKVHPLHADTIELGNKVTSKLTK